MVCFSITDSRENLWCHITYKQQTTIVYPSSLCHGVDVDSLGLFEVALQVKGPEHCGAFLVDEEATSLEAVGVAGRHESVPVEKNSSDASVARVVWWMKGAKTDV